MPDECDFVLTHTYSTNYGALGHIHLNRPKALNVLNHNMILSIAKTLDAWSNNSDIAGVCITGAGKAFCAGGDVKSLYQNGIKKIDQSMDFFKDEYQLNQLIYDYKKPYIAILHGVTMGGGAGISIPGKYRIACENLTFAMPETRIGLFPDVGMLYYLAKMPKKIGLYLSLTGESINIEAAKQLGLVDYAIHDHRQSGLIDALCKLPDLSDRRLRDFFQTIEKKTATLNLTNFENILRGETLRDMLLNLEKSKSSESEKTRKMLLAQSPHSLDITFSAFKDATQQDFKSILSRNLIDAQRCLAHSDFYEGVRARLIDKDNQPKWQKTCDADKKN